jgi:hypothetical protein
MSEERLNGIKDAILKVAQRQDEFRQADVRAELDGVGSGPMAVAFEILRQQKVIRLARVERIGGPGGGKWFRLTDAALRS